MRILATICLLFVVQTMVAQEKRLLFHYSRYKEVIYYVGDVISFRLKGSREEITWPITGITDSTIVSADRSIEPNKIGAIYVDRKSKIFFPFRFKYSPYLMAAGGAYFAIDAINSKHINRSTVIISSSMIVAGALLGLIIKDYVKLKPPRKLVILR